MPDVPVLFYSPMTCAASEILAFEWAGLPYHLCRVTREERKSDGFRTALNPNGQVPVLLFPDGRILAENAAILAWIGDQVPEKGLTPAFGTSERYVFYFWLSWFDSTFHAAHTPLFAPGRIHPDPAQHEAIKAQGLASIAELLPRVERHLEGREFFFMERRTVLDGYVFAMGRWSEKRLDYATRFPRFAAFLDRMRQDPAVQFLLALEKDETVREHVPFQEVLASV